MTAIVIFKLIAIFKSPFVQVLLQTTLFASLSHTLLVCYLILVFLFFLYFLMMLFNSKTALPSFSLMHSSLLRDIKLIYYMGNRQHGLRGSMRTSTSQIRTIFAKLCIVLSLVCVIQNFLSGSIQSLLSVLSLKHAKASFWYLVNCWRCSVSSLQFLFLFYRSGWDSSNSSSASWW